ncbi:hypothetical protein ElyMa_002394900 [Elysia marginata]|uniref:Uncharacterized protein n=1 Tax=Elysia marginata TaxID=1093978 RepID=A0AAV4GE54_9GAST|nr:hypothetical protein ElyMa_002394900 [Elysia marginata]
MFIVLANSLPWVGSGYFILYSPSYETRTVADQSWTLDMSLAAEFSKEAPRLGKKESPNYILSVTLPHLSSSSLRLCRCAY